LYVGEQRELAEPATALDRPSVGTVDRERELAVRDGEALVPVRA
jgi:hypothetical protein